MEMDPATFPLVTLVRGEFLYNELHGYVFEQDVAFVAENITVLGENRETGFHVDTYGNEITAIDIEVRTMDGGRLVEQNPVTDYKQTGWTIDGFIYLKDLLEIDEIYSLRIALTIKDEKTLYYYTNVVWSEETNVDSKLEFVQYFHDTIINKMNTADIKKYLETNSQLNDNKNFAYVDIHSSVSQVMYGDLALTQLDEPKFSLKEISSQMAEITLDYYMFETSEDGRRTNYRLLEYFRVKQGNERMLLIDYQRHMQQLPQDSELCVNDKIVLGITEKEADFLESEDGNTVAFISAGKLYSYQASSNKLTKVFSFSGVEGFDPRAEYTAHEIKILDIDEAGTMQFAVYGYMNSGRHEGEVGVEIYRFDGKLNTIEELLYIPYDGTYGVLKAELDTLLYLNRENHLYITFENKVYFIDMDNKTIATSNNIENDDKLTSSKDHRILVSTIDYEDTDYAKKIVLTNLNNEKEFVITADEGDVLKPMGFIAGDVIYGAAHIEDIRVENSGKLFFPMYKLVFCDETGEELKTYQYQGYYVTDLKQNANQLVLDRVRIDDAGRRMEAEPDYISVGNQGEGETVTDATTIIDKYKTYVQLQLPKAVNTDKLKIAVPKEIVYEGERDIEIDRKVVSRYYVFDAYGLAKIFNMEANAVNMAYEKAGWVVDIDGTLLWKRTDRRSKNQIMSITEDVVTEEKNSLAVCMDSLMKNEGIIRNSNYLLSQGGSVLDILSENLEGMKVLNLEDCEIDSILYFVNNEIPVLVLTGTNSALLIVGYNDPNSYLVILNPDNGTLDKISYEDAERMFETTGNFFITYVKGGK